MTVSNEVNEFLEEHRSAEQVDLKEVLLSITNARWRAISRALSVVPDEIQNDSVLVTLVAAHEWLWDKLRGQVKDADLWDILNKFTPHQTQELLGLNPEAEQDGSES